MFKLNISNKKGKTYHLELESEELIGKQIGDKLEGKDINSDLEGYEMEIVGGSDKAGFPLIKSVEGFALKRLLLNYGQAMHKRSKREGKKKRSNPKPKGLRLRKTVRGKIISADVVQINLKVLKDGKKKLEEIFPDQGKGKTKVNRKTKRAEKKETKKEEPIAETAE
ncbi:MAG: S6e family ribosomal protein [archaeon]|nr:S6e family ribosomal protein [archaeon]